MKITHSASLFSEKRTVSGMPMEVLFQQTLIHYGDKKYGNNNRSTYVL